MDFRSEIEEVLMHRVLALVSVLALALGACSGATDGAADTAPASITEGGGEPIVMRMSMAIAARPGAEIPATGKVLDGSTLGAAPFCVGGTVEDLHPDPGATPPRLLDRTITCPDGTVTLGLTPETWATLEPPKDRPQGGTWIIVGGTGTFEGLSGSGMMEATYDPDNEPDKESLSDWTLTGTVTR